MKHGQLNQFRTLFQKFYPDMVKVALFYVRDNAAAEDITQEVFAKLWENFNRTESIENLKGYLQYAVKNRSLNYLGHLQVVDKYQQAYLQHLKEDEQSPEEYIHLVQKLLSQLPEKRRKVLEMSVVESMSYQEISIELNISVNTVKDHIKKAYAFLREKMTGEISRPILFLLLKI